MVANDQGNMATHSSSVAFSDSERLIGDAIRNQPTINPINTVFVATLARMGCHALASEKVDGSRSGPHDVIAEIPASQKKRYKRWSIPHDLLAEILSRVPGRSLVRFRCVSKFWYSSFRDPHFVSLHLNQATKNPPSYFLGYMDGWRDQDQISFYSFEIDGVEIEMVAGKILTVPVKRDKYFMSNPCNGLIAFHGYCRAYVANPCTLEWIALPKPTPHTSKDGWGLGHMTMWKDGRAHLGLGFSTATREYKLVRFFYHCDVTSLSWACEVLTLGTDRSWRSLGDVPFWVTEFEPAYADDCIYWTIENNGSPERIVSFDVCREELMMIWLPSCVHPEPYGAYRYLCMRVFEGSLCLIDYRLLLDEERMRYCPVVHIHAALEKKNHKEGEGGSLIWSERSHNIWLRGMGVRTKSGGPRGTVANSMYPVAIENGKLLLYRPRCDWMLQDLDTGVTLKIEFLSVLEGLRSKGGVAGGSLI